MARDDPILDEPLLDDDLVPVPLAARLARILDERAWRILDARAGVQDRLTYAAIARDLGITHGRVWDLYRDLGQRLAHPSRLGPRGRSRAPWPPTPPLPPLARPFVYTGASSAPCQDAARAYTNGRNIAMRTYGARWQTPAFLRLRAIPA